uniref:Uncharacterized protein n=1 Tax=Arundo donax TaxID=35708 RepID=A0A0A9C575_ARUDO
MWQGPLMKKMEEWCLFLGDKLHSLLMIKQE